MEKENDSIMVPVINEMVKMPDGSGCFVMDLPLPDDHWIYEDKENIPPESLACMKNQFSRGDLENAIRDAAKYAVRCATWNGRCMDFDPDAIVQAMVRGLLGPCGNLVEAKKPEGIE